MSKEQAPSQPGYSFWLPKVYGVEEPTAENCCEVFGPLVPNREAGVLGNARKAIIVGAQKAGTTYLASTLEKSPQAMRFMCPG